MMLRIRILILLSVATLSQAAFCRLEATDVLVGANVGLGNQIPLSQIDHSAWDGLLKKYVNSQGMVNYTAWKSAAQDVKILDQHCNRLCSPSQHGRYTNIFIVVGTVGRSHSIFSYASDRIASLFNIVAFLLHSVLGVGVCAVFWFQDLAIYFWSALSLLFAVLGFVPLPGRGRYW